MRWPGDIPWRGAVIARPGQPRISVVLSAEERAARSRLARRIRLVGGFGRILELVAVRSRIYRNTSATMRRLNRIGH